MSEKFGIKPLFLPTQLQIVSHNLKYNETTRPYHSYPHQIQPKKLVIDREMTERFDVTHRTIYRDIQTLRLAGVPIGEEEK